MKNKNIENNFNRRIYLNIIQYFIIYHSASVLCSTVLLVTLYLIPSAIDIRYVKTLVSITLLVPIIFYATVYYRLHMYRFPYILFENEWEKTREDIVCKVLVPCNQIEDYTLIIPKDSTDNIRLIIGNYRKVQCLTTFLYEVVLFKSIPRDKVNDYIREATNLLY